MNNSRSADHPWRTRTHEFQTHLAALPPEAQRRIKNAERGFLAQREQPYSVHFSAARDFNASMIGAQETVDEE
jgi:hypothetical protein